MEVALLVVHKKGVQHFVLSVVNSLVLTSSPNMIQFNEFEPYLDYYIFVPLMYRSNFKNNTERRNDCRRILNSKKR